MTQDADAPDPRDRPELARYQCEEVCSERPIPCDVLADVRGTELPDHLCAVMAHRLTSRFAADVAPMPPGIARSGRLAWTRRRVPEQPLDQIAWLRWRWSRQWPLTPDGGELARRAADLAIEWELVVPPGVLPPHAIGVAVNRETDDEGCITLLGQVATEVPERAGHRMIEYTFVEPLLRIEVQPGPRGGARTALAAAGREAQRLLAWYQEKVLGMRLPGAGRPPAVTFAELSTLMAALTAEYRDAYEEGRAESPRVRLTDLSVAAGCSPDTVRRAVRAQDLTFAQFRAWHEAAEAADG